MSVSVGSDNAATRLLCCSRSFSNKFRAYRALPNLRSASAVKKGVVFMEVGNCMDLNPCIRRVERLKVYFDVLIFPGLRQSALAPKRILLFSFR